MFTINKHDMKLLGMLIRFISESGFQRNILAFGRERIMNDVQQRDERSVLRAYDEHAPMLYRIAFTYLKNQYDSEDALQECFLRYLRSSPSFSDPQHEKAWLIVTVGNICRDMLRSRSRRHESLEDHGELAVAPPETDDLMGAILWLPDRYKTAIYLYYYEGYSVDEIAHMLHKPSNTIKTRLARARKLLKNELGGDLDA